MTVRTRRRNVMVAVLLSLGLVLTACGSDTATTTATADASPESETAATADASPTAEPTEAAATAVPSGELEEGESPIENLLGVPVFDEAAMDRWFEDLSREAEIVVATCMRSEGFEYTPVAIGGTGDKTELPRDSREYAEQRGLGIVASFNEAEYNPATAAPDRNAGYVASLGEGERDAYQVALTGNTEPSDNPFGEAGCRGVATEEVFAIVGVFDAIEPVFDSYYDLYISDSRIIATTTQWQQCMSQAGYLFGDEDEMYSHVYSQINEIMSDPANLADFDPDDFANNNGDRRPALAPAAQAIIDELGDEEKAIAVANWECTEPIKETELAVQREYEDRFVTEVGPQVRELRGEG